MKERRHGVSSILGLVIIVAIVFPTVWIWFRMMHAEMSVIQADTINRLAEKGRFEITMLKESYEKPALLFSLMKSSYDYTFHGAVTSKLISKFGIVKRGKEEYIKDVVIDAGGGDVECARIEEVDGRYVLYWVQTEETGTKVYKPIAYFDDLEQVIRRGRPVQLKFRTDYGFKVGEVAVALYFLKDNVVTIKSGGVTILKAENTGVYFVDGKDIKGNTITLETLVDNATVIRGVIATTYKGNETTTYAEFADCARKMVQDFMDEYFKIFYRKIRPTNFYGMEFNGSGANITFDPNIERVHGSVWMHEGMNITKYYNDTARTPMLLLHSNMFTETNLSARLAVLIDYGTEFVTHTQDWLVNAIYLEMNRELKDFYFASRRKCGPLSCGDCPEENIPTYDGQDFVRVINNALTELENELNSQSLPGIKWDLVFLEDKHKWMPINTNKKPCCGSMAGASRSSPNPFTLRDLQNFITFFSFEEVPERKKIQNVYASVCEGGIPPLDPCSELIAACSTLPSKEYDYLCTNPVKDYISSHYGYDLFSLCSNLPHVDLCAQIATICQDSVIAPEECTAFNDSINSYIRSLFEARDALLSGIGKEKLGDLYKELSPLGTSSSSGCGLVFEYEPDVNIIHVEYQRLEDEEKGRCGDDCCKCEKCFHKYHICKMYYYHRYIFRDLKIMIRIIDENHKVLVDEDDDKVYEWKPLELDFIVNINVDDNTCGVDYCVFKDEDGNVILPPEEMKEITPQFIIAGIYSYSISLPTEEELRRYWRE